MSYKLKLQSEASWTEIFEDREDFYRLAKLLLTEITANDSLAESIAAGEFMNEDRIRRPEDDDFDFVWPVDLIYFHKLVYYENTRRGITPGEAWDIAKLYEKYPRLPDEELSMRWRLIGRFHQRAVDEETVLLLDN